MRNPSLISFCALPVPIILFITFHRMWLVSGNGNANYIYFQCLAYGMFVLIITMDFVSATVKRDKVRRMIEKGTIAKLLLTKKEGIESDNAATTNASQPIDTNNEGVDKIDDANLEPEPTVVFI
jgi:phosphatidylinositol glycan class U